MASFKRTLRSVLLIIFLVDIFSERISPAYLRSARARKRRDTLATMSSILTALGFNSNNGVPVNSALGTAGNALQQQSAPSAMGGQAIDLFSRGLLMLKQITETQMTRNGTDPNDIKNYDDRMEALRARLADLGEKVQAIINALGQLQGLLQMPFQSAAGVAPAAGAAQLPAAAGDAPFVPDFI